MKHFYFLSWPDHGVPNDTGAYISFYNRIQTSIARLTTPLIVHCRFVCPIHADDISQYTITILLSVKTPASSVGESPCTSV